MKNTVNYNLKKPELTDYVNIQNINDNMDVLDGEVYDLQTKVSTETVLNTTSQNLSGAVNEVKSDLDAHKADKTAHDVASNMLSHIAKTNFKLDAYMSASKNSVSKMIIDSLNDANGVNAGASLGYYHNTTDRAIEVAFSQNLCVGGTPIASSSYSDRTPSKVFDGATNSYWDSGETAGGRAGVSYIGYVFSSPRVIRKININQAASVSQIKTIKIQNSQNGTSWQDVVLNINATIDSIVVDIPILNSARYWRVLCESNQTGNTAGYRWRVLEIEMFERYGNTVVQWLPDVLDTTPSKVYVIADKAGDINFYLSRDNGNTFTIAPLETIIDISAQPVGQQLVCKAVLLTENSILRSIAWGWI